MIEEKSLEEIIIDVKKARKSKTKLAWSPEEIASNMLVASKQLQVNLEKYLRKGMDAPAERVRALSKIIETLGKAFRVQSVK